jgi:signal transduction histidine kinase
MENTFNRITKWYLNKSIYWVLLYMLFLLLPSNVIEEKYVILLRNLLAILQILFLLKILFKKDSLSQKFLFEFKANSNNVFYTSLLSLIAVINISPKTIVLISIFFLFVSFYEIFGEYFIPFQFIDFKDDNILESREFLYIGVKTISVCYGPLFLSLLVLNILLKPILGINASLTLHQIEEEARYEELRTRFAFHNITKDVRNLKSYITILKHEEPQLLAKFNTLDELTYMVEDTLNKFKNSDTIRTKNPFLVHELFDNFLIINKPDLVREGSDLQIEYQKTEYKNVEIHQTFYEVYQVLNNLIDNARKAIANVEQKEIQILTSVSKEGFVDFRVSDTGVGIEAKSRNLVFDIGYSTTNGDGLGLLFVQTTLKRFGGEIQLLPTAISGFSTTFEVRIPTQKG